MNKYLAGAIAGTAATIPMTVLMVYMHRRIPASERKTLPPKQITKEVVSGLGAQDMVDEKTELETMSAASHLAYGAASGAAYALIAPLVDLPPAMKGTLFGLAVWTGSYLGWLPMAGVRQSATKRPMSESAMMIAAHIVFGMFLGRWMASLSDE